MGAQTQARRWPTLLLALAAGVCMWAAFPDQGIYPLAVVAVALLHLALRRDQAGWGFLVGFVAGLTFFLPLVRWAYYATETLPWIALGLLGALGFGTFGAAWTWARRLPLLRERPWWDATAFAVVFVAVEQGRSSWPWGGFPWGRLAWSVAGAPTGRAAWLGGTILVSFLLALAGSMLVLAGSRAWQAWQVRALVLRPESRVTDQESASQPPASTPTLCEDAEQQYIAWSYPGRTLTAVAGAVMVTLAVVVGPLALPLPHDPNVLTVPNPGATAPIAPGDRTVFVSAGFSDGPTAEVGTLHVGVVQGDVPKIGGLPQHNAQGVLENHLNGTHLLAADQAVRTEQGVPDPLLDVVLWPEDSSGWDPRESFIVADWLDQASRAVGVPVLIGAQYFPAGGGRYNNMMLWQVGAGVIDLYAKQLPAPFGEFIPWRPFFRLLSDQIDRVTTDMFAATNPPIIELSSARLGREVRLGVGICFEVGYDWILRDATRGGAEVLVVPTNNASFGHTAQSTQQLQMTQLQAIANGRAAVQVSTVGVSGVFTPDGRLVARTGLFVGDRINAVLPLRTTLTPATRAGAAWEVMFSAVGGLLVLAGFVAGIVERRRTNLVD